LGDQIEKNGVGGHVALMGEGEAHSGFWWGNHLEDPGVVTRIVLKWIFRK